jgi:cell division protein FtsQ
MKLGRHRNRRRPDAQQRKAKLKLACGRLARLAAKGLMRIALAAGVVAGSMFAYRWALRSPQLALTHISFRGLRQVTEAELLQLTGLSLGENIFRVDCSSLEQIVASHPWVRRAKVDRRIPHQLLIQVDEFKPIAIVSLGQRYLLDAEGRPFKRVQPSDSVDLPRVTGISREQYLREPEAASARLQQATEMMADYRRFDPTDPLSEIRLEAIGITLISQSGVEVHFGEGERAAKFARLRRIRSELSRKGLLAQSIRLDNRVRPGWIAVRPSRTSAEGDSQGIGNQE